MRSKMTNKRSKALVGLSVVALLLGALAQSALAHTHVAESNPADGAKLEAPPTEILVRFGEPDIPAQPAQISDAHLEVFDACGVQVDKKDSTVNMQDSSVKVTSAGSPAGRYEIHWFATASDGAAQSGILDFNVTKGAPCTSASRDDVKEDTELSADLLTVATKVTKRGGAVTLTAAEALDCASYGAEADNKLTLQLDTNLDRNSDFVGSVVCKKNVWKMNLKSAEEETTGSLKMKQPSPTTLRVQLPKQLLVAHVDLWAESSSEADDCDTKVCFDRAPDLGLVRAY